MRGPGRAERESLGPFFFARAALFLALSPPSCYARGMPRRPRLLSLLALGLGLTGCEQAFGTKDAHQPGELLGTFHVTATRSQNSCGEGALGSTPSWEFDVTLAKDRTTLFWDNGAQVISGGGADGKSFQIDADVVMNMRQEGDNGPPCSVNRHDRATVTLAGSDTNVPSFTGTLAYAFAPTTGSDCTDLILGGAPNPKTAMPVFAQLPCSFTYDMSAERAVAP